LQRMTVPDTCQWRVAMWHVTLPAERRHYLSARLVRSVPCCLQAGVSKTKPLLRHDSSCFSRA
jgi:hypothetical protein